MIVSFPGVIGGNAGSWHVRRWREARIDLLLAGIDDARRLPFE
jgi:hypothetical protein